MNKLEKQEIQDIINIIEKDKDLRRFFDAMLGKFKYYLETDYDILKPAPTETFLRLTAISAGVFDIVDTGAYVLYDDKEAEAVLVLELMCVLGLPKETPRRKIRLLNIVQGLKQIHKLAEHKTEILRARKEIEEYNAATYATAREVLNNAISGDKAYLDTLFSIDDLKNNEEKK